MAANKLHVKKNDMVMIIAGKDKGKIRKGAPGFSRQGTGGGREPQRRQTAHPPDPGQHRGRHHREGSSPHASNVLLVCGACNKPTRTGVRTLEDGSKARFCKKCNEIVDK